MSSPVRAGAAGSNEFSRGKVRRATADTRQPRLTAELRGNIPPSRHYIQTGNRQNTQSIMNCLSELTAIIYINSK